MYSTTSLNKIVYVTNQTMKSMCCILGREECKIVVVVVFQSVFFLFKKVLIKLIPVH
jgi:hypothetical protein